MTGAELKVLRVRLGVTRQELGDAIGVNPVTVWRWETGKTNNSRSPSPSPGPSGVGGVPGAGVPSAAVEYLRGVAQAQRVALEAMELYAALGDGIASR